MTYALDLGRLARTGAPSVLNTQALRDLVFYNEKPPMAVIVLNAKVFGDRGGGVWQWSADSVLDDDFGVIVLPTGQSATTLGRWHRKFVKATNVLWWGLAMNGVSDDAVGIQAALDAGYSSYHIPSGDYWFGSTLVNNRDMVSIFGDGQYVTNIHRLADGYDLIHMSFVEGGTQLLKEIEIRDISFDSNTVGLINTSGAAVRLTNVSKGTISGLHMVGGFESLVVEGCSNMNIQTLNLYTNTNFGGLAAPGSSLIRFDPTALSKCAGIAVSNVNARTTDGAAGLLESALVITDADGIWFSNMHVGFADKYGVLIKPATISTNVNGLNFSNVHVDGNADVMQYGIYYDIPAGYIGECRAHTLANCTISHCSNTGIYLPADLTQGIKQLSMSGGRINGCEEWGFHAVNGYDISLQGVQFFLNVLGSLWFENVDSANVDCTFSQSEIGFRINKESTRCRVSGVWYNCDEDVQVLGPGTNITNSVAGLTSKINTIAVSATLDVPLPGDTFFVTGTGTVTGISDVDIFLHRKITLVFLESVTLTDSATLRLAGNFVGTPWSSITLIYNNGNTWSEIARAIV